MTRATIVIPTCNRCDMLDRALRSALAQSLDDFEVVVVDDGSTDGTPGVVARYAGDPRLVYHRQEENVGMVRNHGDGVRLARGSFVTFLADDDEVGPEFLARRVDRIEADPRLLAVFSPYTARGRDGSLVQDRRGKPQVLKGFRLLRAAVTHRWFIAGALYRRDALLEVWPELATDGHAFDLGMNLRLALRPGARGACVAAADYIKTEHDAQYSSEERSFADRHRVLQDVEAQRLAWVSARVIRRAAANSLTAWGRALARQGREREARRVFLRAVAHDRLAHWPWRQLARSILWPLGR